MIIISSIPKEEINYFSVTIPEDAEILMPKVWGRGGLDFSAKFKTIDKERMITRYFGILDNENHSQCPDDKIKFLYPTEKGWFVEFPEQTPTNPDKMQPQTGCFRVEKYKLECEHNKVRMPVGSRVMQAGDDGDVICLWCLVDTRVKETEERKFDLYFTDELIAGHGSYVGTVRLPQGVYHVIEVEG